MYVKISEKCTLSRQVNLVGNRLASKPIVTHFRHSVKESFSEPILNEISSESKISQ